MVAAEVERKKLRRAETAGITAAGTVGRAEGLNVQGVTGDHDDNSYFNSGRLATATAHLRKSRTIQEKSSAGFGECNFLGQ